MLRLTISKCSLCENGYLIILFNSYVGCYGCTLSTADESNKGIEHWKNDTDRVQAGAGEPIAVPLCPS